MQFKILSKLKQCRVEAPDNEPPFKRTVFYLNSNIKIFTISSIKRLCARSAAIFLAHCALSFERYQLKFCKMTESEV